MIELKVNGFQKFMALKEYEIETYQDFVFASEFDTVGKVQEVGFHEGCYMVGLLGLYVGVYNLHSFKC